jgi:sec-independent protein translocase protein TatA
MPSISPVEIVVVAAIALIVFGPHRLPEIARNIAKAIRELRRMASDVRDEFDLSLDEEPARDHPAKAEPHPDPEPERPAAPPLARGAEGSEDDADERTEDKT